MSRDKRRVSYGQTEDEFIEIESLSDEVRFKICMKLYKTHKTVKDLESVISPEALALIQNRI